MAKLLSRGFERVFSGAALLVSLVLLPAFASAQGAKVRHNEVKRPSPPASSAAQPVPPAAAAAPSAAPEAPGSSVVSPPPVPGPPPAERPPLPNAPAQPTVGPDPAPGIPPVPRADAPAERETAPAEAAVRAPEPVAPSAPAPEKSGPGAAPVEPATKTDPAAPRVRHAGAHAPSSPLAPASPPRFTYETGEWVYTNDYGWIWIPKDVSVVGANQTPYAFLYTPYFGWSWYVSPWGAGPYSYGDWAFRSAIGLAFWAEHRRDSVTHHGRPDASAPQNGPRGGPEHSSTRGQDRAPSAGGHSPPQARPVPRPGAPVTPHHGSHSRGR